MAVDHAQVPSQHCCFCLMHASKGGRQQLCCIPPSSFTHMARLLLHSHMLAVTTFRSCSVIHRHESESRTNSYWCELMGGLQGDWTPQKDMSCIRELSAIVNSVTAQDLQLLLSTLTLSRVSLEYSACNVCMDLHAVAVVNRALRKHRLAITATVCFSF